MKKVLKACLNVDCNGYAEKKKYTNLERFCIYCGSPLQQVCETKGCLNIVDDFNESLCEEHKEALVQKKQERKEAKAKNIEDAKTFVKDNAKTILPAAGKAVGAAAPIVVQAIPGVGTAGAAAVGIGAELLKNKTNKDSE